MNLNDVLDVVILHNLDPQISTNYMDHEPGKLCLQVQDDGIHYALCKKNYECFGSGVWGNTDKVTDVIKFIHSSNPRKVCRYCTITI